METFAFVLLFVTCSVVAANDQALTLESMTEVVRTLQHSVQRLQADNAMLQHSAQRIQEDNAIFKQSVQRFQADNAILKQSVQRFQADNAILKHSVQRLQGSNNILRSENRRLDEEIKNLWILQNNCEKYIKGSSHLQMTAENGIKFPKQTPSSPTSNINSQTPMFDDKRHGTRKQQPRLLLPTTRNVAFSAKLSHDVGNLTSSNTIVFDQVLTNYGNMYNQHVGDFSCYYAGVYVFFVNILSEGPHTIETDIMKNGKDIASTFSYDKDSFSSGSNMVIVQLEVGDRVWVRVHRGDTGFIIDFKFSTFSGFLLF